MFIEEISKIQTKASPDADSDNADDADNAANADYANNAGDADYADISETNVSLDAASKPDR
jgi:hypothetical protein